MIISPTKNHTSPSSLSRSLRPSSPFGKGRDREREEGTVPSAKGEDVQEKEKEGKEKREEKNNKKPPQYFLSPFLSPFPGQRDGPKGENGRKNRKEKEILWRGFLFFTGLPLVGDRMGAGERGPFLDSSPRHLSA